MNSVNTTTWKCSVTQSNSGPIASMTVTTNGSAVSPFRIKGVCYSPCPIGGSNNNASNIGDWFWDTYTSGSTTITSWEQTWENDLPKIKALGINTIRVYCMLSQQLPNQWNTDTIFTHQKFLDACYQLGIYVLVGFPLPTQLFDSGQVPTPDQTWWQNNLQTTVTNLGSHPAVMGFIIANEVDNGSVDTYGPSTNQTYWWSQVQAMALIAKTAAPDKLIGISNHDDPGICENCETEMATCTSIDFWGVNTYQPQTFASVFGNSTITSGYAKLSGAALKPVILTEYGFPATSRTSENTLSPLQIMSNTETQQNVATVLETMLPAAYAEQMNLGVCYFEYCDEWWNQSGYTLSSSGSCPTGTGPYAPNGSNSSSGTAFNAPNDYTWFGGPIACGFPNYYWDNEGFGLYAVAVGSNRNPAQPWDQSTNSPALPLDTRTPRTPITSQISTFNNYNLISGFVTAIDQVNGSTQVSVSSDEYGRPPATGKPGSLTNYFYMPGNLSQAEETELANAKTSGKYVTLVFNDDRSIVLVVTGS
ncbi:cellulase family glycosylhydrolase [Fluviicola taffensis]|uniref:cellulase family glycosylhydrolase n=1 Tax=Fluviicola taffensis TaxID=191579 RepID=UPI00313847D2